MGTYPAWLEKSTACLCNKFEQGGLFSPSKFAEKCGENFHTAQKHLSELVNTDVCGKRLVRVSSNRYTLIVEDDPFESDELYTDTSPVPDDLFPFESDKEPNPSLFSEDRGSDWLWLLGLGALEFASPFFTKALKQLQKPTTKTPIVQTVLVRLKTKL